LVVRLVLSAVAFVLVYPQIADRMDMSLLGIQGSGWSKFGKWGFSRELADIILMKKNPRLKAKAVDVWITTAWHECRVHALSRWIYNSNSERHPHVGTFFEYLIGKAEDLVIAPWVDAWRKWRSVRPSEKDHVDNRFGWPAVTGQSSWVPLERPTSAAPAKVIVLHSPDPELRARPQRSISQTLSLLDGHFFSDPQGLSELVAVLKTMKDMGVQQILAVGVSIYQVSEAFATMGFNTFLMDASLGMINSLIPVRPRKNMVGRYELIHANLDFVELPMNSLLQPDSCDAALLLSLVGGTVSFVGDPFRAIVNAVRYVRHGGTLYLPVEAIPVEMRSKGITLGEILVMLYPGSFRNTTLPPLMSYHGEVNVPYTLVKGAA
jgi:hypothetical protein